MDGNKSDYVVGKVKKRHIKAVEQLQEHTIDNPFFPEYIAFISSVDATQLKKHLQAVMKGWYEHVVAPKHAEIKQFLERDIQAKIKMQAQLSRRFYIC